LLRHPVCTYHAAVCCGAQISLDRACARKPEHTMTKKPVIAEKPSVVNDIARDRIFERAPAR
jgi:hypothetical protein